jgi:hypothetical protein
MATAMAYARHRPFLDRPIARVLAGVVFLACVGALVYLERERLWQVTADQSAADDPVARCYAERATEIDRMVADNAIDDAQAELFKTRAEAMCRATLEGSERGPPLLPTQ